MRTPTYRLICLCTLANLINSADRVIMPIAIIQMAPQFGWNIFWKGWILSSFAFGYIASQIVGATVAQRYGAGRMLSVSVFFWSLSTLLTPLVASHLYLFILFRVLLGFGEGLGLPMIFQLFSTHVPVSQRSRAFGYLISAGTVGQTLSALVTPHLYWPVMFYFFGSFALLWVLLWYNFYHRTFLVEEARVLDEAQDPLVVVTDPKSGPTRPIPHHWTRFIQYWPLWAIYIAHFGMNWSNYIIMQWLPYYLSRYLGADEKSLSLTALPYIMNSISGIGAGHFADNLITERKWSILSVRRLMTVIGLFGSGFCMLLFGSLSSLLSAVIVICLAMSFCAFNSAGHLSNHTDVAPNHAGITFAIANTLATIPGILCGPLTAELVTQSQGRWLPVFVLASAVNFVGAIVYASQSSASPVL